MLLLTLSPHISLLPPILPPSLSLQVVNASHNALRDSGLPSDLFKVKELVTLDLSHNCLTKVPEDMDKAKNLIVISLSHNKISTMPGAVSVVWHYTRS